ncbi:MAG: TetR/AcrR family transcriptional regulator [Myxococcota bacterium]|nr:TetR/AcrR family transcriptional regulator [Myxococcota bacterium]
MAEAAKRTRLGRGEWIQESLQVLAEEGVEAVRVEPLAKRLGVTKGSFYHHFDDRDELLVAVLDAWFQQATMLVIEIVNRRSRRPEERLRHLLELVIDAEPGAPLPRVDLAIRGWARWDRRARSMLEAMDAKRLEYISGRLLALGCERVEAEDRSFLIYAYIMGEGQIARTDSHAVRAHRVERCLARLVLDLPGVGSVEEPS